MGKWLEGCQQSALLLERLDAAIASGDEAKAWAVVKEIMDFENSNPYGGRALLESLNKLSKAKFGKSFDEMNKEKPN